LDKALGVATALSKEWGCAALTHNPKIAILSVHGTGLRSHTGLAFRMFKTLADGGINVNIICTSERNIGISVNDENGEKGLELLKKEFAKEMM
jgi:aspartate kinase